MYARTGGVVLRPHDPSIESPAHLHASNQRSKVLGSESDPQRSAVDRQKHEERTTHICADSSWKSFQVVYMTFIGFPTLHYVPPILGLYVSLNITNRTACHAPCLLAIPGSRTGACSRALSHALSQRGQEGATLVLQSDAILIIIVRKKHVETSRSPQLPAPGTTWPEE